MWTGIGYTEIPYLKGQRIAVEFRDARVNDCYEYTGGGTVQSAYDPSWWNVRSADKGVQQIGTFYQQLSQRFVAFQTKLANVNKLLENPSANANAIRDSLVAGQAELDSLLAQATCMSDEDKNQLRQDYNQLKTIGGASGGRLAASASTTTWADLGNKVTSGFNTAKACTQEQMDIVYVIIQLLRKNTQFGNALSHANALKLSGDTRCSQMFTEGFLNELLSQIDVLTLEQEIRKIVNENLRQLVKGEHKYQNLLDCFSPKLAVTGDLSGLNNCSQAIQLVLTDLLGGTTALYNNAKAFATKVYDCDCFGSNAQPTLATDDCAYSTGRLTAFTLTALAPLASKFAKTAEGFVLGAEKISKQALTDVASKIKTGATDAVISFRLALFKSETGISLRTVIDDVLLKKARDFQGKGIYPGIDDWVIVELPEGATLFGGLPGQSSFYTVENTLSSIQLDKVKFWGKLQVGKNPERGFRPYVGVI